MSYLTDPVVALFVSLALGHLLGRLRVGPVALGERHAGHRLRRDLRDCQRAAAADGAGRGEPGPGAGRLNCGQPAPRRHPLADARRRYGVTMLNQKSKLSR